MFSIDADSPIRRPLENNVSVSLRTLNFISNERVVFMLLLSTVWTLLLTIIPVVTSIPPNDYYLPERDWYTGDDVMRFVEPVGGLLLNCIVFYQAPIFHLPSTTPKPNSLDNTGGLLALPESWVLLSIFAIALAIYQQGAGFHSAANMFKNALQTIIDSDGDDTVFNNQLHTLYFYIRTVWQHDISHYLYAVGLIGAQMCQLYAHWQRRGNDPFLTSHLLLADDASQRLTESQDLTPSLVTRVLLFWSALSYGILVAAVAINYPAGLIVGLVYVLLLFTVIIVTLALEYKNESDKLVWQFGHRPVVQHFGIGCVWAFVFIILWIIANGGIAQRSQSSL